MLTLRFYVLALGVPALLILSVAFPWLATAGAIYGAGLLLLALLDRRAAGTLDQFKVTRQHDHKLSLGVPNRILVQVAGRVPRPIRLMLRDEPPLLFSLVPAAPGEKPSHVPLLTTLLPAGSPLEWVYFVRPLKRGDYAFGSMTLRWSGPLDLVQRQGTVPAAAAVKVYPNLHNIREYDLLARRDQLAGIGLKNVRQIGEGTAFESLRDYTPDDAYRTINWKATARRGKPIATDYEPERSQRVMIAVDVGRMMRSPIRIQESDGAAWNMAKVDFVLNSVLLFSYVAALRGDEVGLLVFADQVRAYYAPQAGRAHFHKLLEAMYRLESDLVEADYGRALTYLAGQNRKRSLVVVFTDLSGGRAGDLLTAHLPRLAPRHLPLLVTIRDPILGEVASRPLHDSETVYQRAVAEQLIDERRLLLETLARRGVLTLDVAAEQLTMAVVNRYLQIKARGMI